MSVKVKFIIPGQPRGKGRPKFRRVGQFTQTYTPKFTREYEKFVRECYQAQVGKTKLRGAISAEMVAYFEIPKSASKKKQGMMFRGEIPCTILNDVDNVAKTIMDSLQKIAFDNDKQVVRLTVEKKWAYNPRVEVELGETEAKYDDSSEGIYQRSGAIDQPRNADELRESGQQTD